MIIETPKTLCEESDVRHQLPRMPSDLELWQLAISTGDEHGEFAAVYVARRLHALEDAEDAAGVATWQAVAHRLDRLSPDSTTPIQ